MFELRCRFEKVLEFFRKHSIVEATDVRRYLRRVVECAVRMMMAAVFAFLLTAILIYLIRGFWFLYTSTPVGERFTAQFPQQAGFLSALTNEPVLNFTFIATRISLQVCVVTAAFCQVFYISRCFYYSRGKIGKTVWAGGVSLLAAEFFQKNWMPIEISVGYAATIVAVLCILPYAFSLADSALPEIGLLFRKSVIKQIYNFFKGLIQGNR